MCLTIPVQIKKINGQKARVDDGRCINISLLDNLEEGDWVLANADLAVDKITTEEAKEIREMLGHKNK